MVSVDVRIMKIDINNGNVIEVSSVKVLDNENPAPTLGHLFKVNQDSISAVFLDVNNYHYLLVDEVLYYCPNSLELTLWTVPFSD